MGREQFARDGTTGCPALRLGTGCPFAARCGEARRTWRDCCPAGAAGGGEHSAACWLWGRERAEELVAAQDKERGERHG